VRRRAAHRVERPRVEPAPCAVCARRSRACMAVCNAQPLNVAGITNPRILTVPGSAAFGHGTDLAGGTVVLNSWSRHYFADACGPLPSAYGAWQLLGRTFSFDVDLSATGCGCNLALYTASMRQNTVLGTCWGGVSGLYYCDANNVCGVRCDEIDIMEANTHAFHSVAHQHWDGGGQGGGFGGSSGHPGSAYGPSASTIDTARPFRVHTTFDSISGLTAITTALEQEGRRTSWSVAPSHYLTGLDSSTRAGLTIVISYWSSGSNGMGWLDRPPCGDYGTPSCGAATLSNFALTGGASPSPLPPLASPPVPSLPAPSPPPPTPTTPPVCASPASLPTTCTIAAAQRGMACACQAVWVAGCSEPHGVALTCT
jgi:hypothetical protein